MGKSIKHLSQHRLSDRKRAVREAECRRREKREKAAASNSITISERATQIGWICISEREFISYYEGEVVRRVAWDEAGTWNCYYRNQKASFLLCASSLWCDPYCQQHV